MIDKKKKIEKEERAVLVGLVHKDQTEPQVQEYLDELAFLAETAGAVSVKQVAFLLCTSKLGAEVFFTFATPPFKMKDFYLCLTKEIVFKKKKGPYW